MTEPHTSSFAAAIAAISGYTVAALGVEWHALLWAFVGVLFVNAPDSPLKTWRFAISLLLATLVGAAGGHGLLAAIDVNKPALLNLASLIIGAGAKPLVFRAVEALGRGVDKLGGKQ